MNEINKKILKNNFYNYKTLLIIIFFIMLIVLSFKYSFFLYPLILILIIILMSIISFIKEMKYINEIYNYKKGIKKFTYKPITVKTQDLIKIIRLYGLPLSYIKINNIYAIEVVKKENKYTCYIDENEYNNIEDFLNTIIDGKELQNHNDILLLSFNEGNPKDFKNIE